MQPERLADHAPNTIALDGVASGLNRDRQTQTRPSLHVNVRRHAKVPVTEAPAVRVHGVELALAAQAPLL